jgi:predicted nucleic acid-binding protein
MTVSKVFVDTAPIIYLFEKNPYHFDRVSYILADYIIANKILVTSVLSVSEVGIKPIKINKPEIFQRFDRTMKSLFHVDPITWEVANLSAKLRAKYGSLKAADSLQLASSIHQRCEVFVTNDRKLKQIKEIPIQLLKDL